MADAEARSEPAETSGDPDWDPVRKPRQKVSDKREPPLLLPQSA